MLAVLKIIGSLYEWNSAATAKDKILRINVIVALIAK